MKNILDYNKYYEAKKNRFPNIKESEFMGFKILLGKDAKSNDHLSINMAKENDVWMHCKGFPGSHVLIRVKDKLPTKEIIKHAAELAKKNSKAKNNDIAEIVYCRAKFVKKKKDMNVGQVEVDYTNSEFIKVK